MLDILAQFDALGLGAVTGSLLFLAGLVWVLVDNRSFEEVNRRHQEAVAPKVPERDDPGGPGRGAPIRPEQGAPGRPVRTRRAA